MNPKAQHIRSRQDEFPHPSGVEPPRGYRPAEPGHIDGQRPNRRRIDYCQAAILGACRRCVTPVALLIGVNCHRVAAQW